jgi:hypothetical protein
METDNGLCDCASHPSRYTVEPSDIAPWQWCVVVACSGCGTSHSQSTDRYETRDAAERESAIDHAFEQEYWSWVRAGLSEDSAHGLAMATYPYPPTDDDD